MKNGISEDHMKKNTILHSYDRFEMILRPLHGQGLIREYRIEPGLTARTWDCHFRDNTELSEELEVPGADCVIAYFPDDVGLKFCNDSQCWNKNGSWNMIFVRRCHLRLFLSALTTYRCMSIHFSLAWFRSNRTKAFELFRLSGGSGKGVVMPDCINNQEMDMVCNMLEGFGKKSMGILSIKTLVFQLVSNFCERIKNMEGRNSIPCNGSDVVTAIEQTVRDHISGALPGLKELAFRFSISESSLKRCFREKHGETITAYFLKKKMAYAKFLIEQRNYSIADASHAVGYKSNYHFMLKYKTFCNPLAVQQDLAEDVNTESKN